MTTATDHPAAATANLTATEFDVTRHDGIVTIHNPATGNHRTFRIRTVKSGNLEGKRIVGLLTGPDNTADYKGFGFADENGVKVWVKHRSTTAQPSDFEVYARMLENPAKFAAKGAEYFISGRCRRCGRLLTTKRSLLVGLGPDCEQM